MGKRTQSFVFSGGGNNSSSRIKQLIWLGILVCLLGGCAQLRSSLITGAAVTTAVGVSSAVMPSAIVIPAVVGGTVGAVASAISAEKSVKGETLQVTADTVVQEAPANFWSLLGQLIEVGGWALILIVLVPMVFSWLMPGPVKFKGREKNNGS